MIADLCLVLLLDASGSIDNNEWELQARATAEALSSKSIVDKITHGAHGRIAVTAMEWSGGQMVMLPWTMIGGMGDAQSAAVIIASFKRTMSGSTAIGNALQAAAAAIRVAPDCTRHVVDVSSDGANNEGSNPNDAIALLQAMGTIVNAIVIEDEIGVLDYYRDMVSGFVMPSSWENYAQAIKAKLQLEIAGLN